MNKTILLVEDDPMISIIQSRVLKKEGYNVISSQSGEKAIEIINNNDSVNMILMDVNLGEGMTGTEAAQEIMKNHDLPVVFLSGHEEKDIIQKISEVSSYGYVVKSSVNSVLLSSVNMAFKLHEANIKLKEYQEKYIDGSFVTAPDTGVVIETNNSFLKASGKDKSEEIKSETISKNNKSSDEILKDVLDVGGLAFWDWHVETGVTKRNERWAEMLGYTLDEIKFCVNESGLSEWDNLIHPDDRGLLWISMNNHLDGLTPYHKVEYRMRAKDGNWKWFSDNAVVVSRDKYGNPVRMSGIHSDITEQKNISEQIKNLTQKAQPKEISESHILQAKAKIKFVIAPEMIPEYELI